MQLAAPANASPTPMTWDRLRFSPVAIYDLRRRLGFMPHESSVYARYQHRFDLSDISWFAAGLASTPGIYDGTPFTTTMTELRTLTPAPTGNDMRRALRERLRTGVFDMVCSYYSFLSLQSNQWIQGSVVGCRLWRHHSHHAR